MLSDRYRSRAARVLIAALVMALVGVAAPSTASSNPYGFVTGTVTGPGGIPAATIDVSMVHQDDSGQITSVGVATTDRYGHYEMWAQPGVHRLLFTPYDETSVYLPVYFPDAPTAETAEAITVTSDSSQTFDIELPTGPRADLTGTVVGTDGAPVPDAQVVVWSDRGTAEEPWWVSRFMVLTDEGGQFHGLVRPGTYRISYRRAGYVESFHGGAATVEATGDLVLADGDAARLDGVLTRETLIRGSVVAASGRSPIPGTEVKFYRNVGTVESPSWSLAGSASPNWNTGAFAKQVAPGSYAVQAVDPYAEYLSEYYDKAFSASTAHLVTIGLESTVTGVNIRMTRRDATPMAATSPPVVTGNAWVGGTLTATAGNWSPTPASTAYQWLRDGVAIAGAVSSGYQPTDLDSGHTLSVRVRAYTPGRYPMTTTSEAVGPVQAGPPVVASRVPSRTTVRVVRKVNRVRLVVRVAAESPVAGKVKVFRGTRRIRTATVDSSRVVFTLKNEPAGTRRYKIAYLGSSTVLPSSKTLRLTF